MQKIRSVMTRLPQSLPHFDAIPRRSGNRGHHDENTRPAFGKTFTGITLTCGLLYIANIAIPGFGFQWNSPYIGFPSAAISARWYFSVCTRRPLR